MMGRERGSSLYSTLLTPKPPASSVYVRVPEARCPHTRSIPVTSLSLLSHYGVSIQGPCRPASQAQRRPSGCPESRTAGAGLSAGETIESSSASHGPRRGGRQGALPMGLRVAVHYLSPLLALQVRLCPEEAPADNGPRPHEERPGRGSEWRRRQASRTASAFLGVGGEIQTLKV